jgi:hypothetical protein
MTIYMQKVYSKIFMMVKFTVRVYRKVANKDLLRASKVILLPIMRKNYKFKILTICV